MAADTADELEKFRQQWQEEVKARSKAAPSKSFKNLQQPEPFRPPRAPSPQPSRAENRPDDVSKAHIDYESHDAYSPIVTHHLRLVEGPREASIPEPQSALDHYEKAVEREGEGSLGDSLKHYRTAYRLDAGVDQLYKKKHFSPAPQPSDHSEPNPSNAAVTVPNTAHHSLHGPQSQSYTDLIASFQLCLIQGVQPPTDASPPPPCPVSSLPLELLVKVLFYVALSDPSSFARLAQVCRGLAYLVATEDRLWSTICESDSFGFRAMHYVWALTVTGRPLPTSVAELDAHLSKILLNPEPEYLQLSQAYPNFQAMFHERPRVRFSGCYISTVNYMRPGAATASQSTWTSPVLIVTYYRYLRFFRDGTCISLLTTTEPSEVVNHLTRENMHTHHAGGLPSAVMNQALRGRWKLKGDPYGVHKQSGEEGILDIETEGADADRPQPKYVYKMMLQMKSARKSQFAARNNKFVWLGYWSYNRLTDDWAEFNLKNDKPFFWSRVRSYGDA